MSATNPQHHLPFEMKELIGRKAELEQLLAIRDRVRQTGKGQFVFVVGSEGYGRKALIRELLKNSDDGSKYLTAATRFWDRAVHSETQIEQQWQADARIKHVREQWWTQIKQIAPEAINIAGYGWVVLVMQLLGKSMPVVEAFRALKSPSATVPDDPHLLKRLVRIAAQSRTVILALEDLDHADSLWIDLLRSFALEIHQDLPVLILASIKSEKPLVGIDEKSLSRPQWLAHDLGERKLASAMFLKPLPREELVQHFCPLTDSLAERLWAFSEGHPLVAQSLWEDWLNGRAIEQTAKGWRERGGHPDWVRGNLKDLTDDALRRAADGNPFYGFDDVRAMLTCAALEGFTFTADALAHAFDIERDDLIDFFDEYLCDADTAILAEADWMEFERYGQTVSLPRYSFRHLYQWHVWSKYVTPEDKREFAARLASGLQTTFDLAESLVARKLSELYALAGNRERANYFRNMADVPASIAVLARQIETARPFADDLTSQIRFYQLLVEYGKRLFYRENYTTLVAVFEEALAIAQQTRVQEDIALALYYLGWAKGEGGEYREARDDLRRAQLLASENGLRSILAATLHALGSIEADQGNYPAARDYYQQSLDLNQELGDKPGTAATLHELGGIEYQQGNYAAAREFYQQSLDLEKELGNKQGTAATLHALGNIEAQQGNYAAGLFYQQSLDLLKELGDKQGTAATLQALGMLKLIEGNARDAERDFIEGLMLAQEIGSKYWIAFHQYSLAQVQARKGNRAEAAQLARAALALWEEFHAPGAELARELLEQLGNG